MKKQAKILKLSGFSLVLVTVVAVTFFVFNFVLAQIYWVGPTADPPDENKPGVIYNAPSTDPVDVQFNANINIDGDIIANEITAAIISGASAINTDKLCLLDNENGDDCRADWPIGGGGGGNFWQEALNSVGGSSRGFIYYNKIQDSQVDDPDRSSVWIYDGESFAGQNNSQAKLEVRGVYVAASLNQTRLILVADSTSDPNLSRTDIIWGDDTSTPLNFKWLNWVDASENPVMTLLPSGNVGIGVTDPNAPLEVNGEIATNRTGMANLRLLSGSNESVLFRNDGSNYFILLTNNGDPWGSWNSLRPLKIDTDDGDVSLGNNTLYVEHLGNVGIGTASPDAALEIQDSGTEAVIHLNATALSGFPSAYLILDNEDDGWAVGMEGATQDLIFANSNNLNEKSHNFMTIFASSGHVSIKDGLNVGGAADPGSGILMSSGSITWDRGLDGTITGGFSDYVGGPFPQGTPGVGDLNLIGGSGNYEAGDVNITGGSSLGMFIGSGVGDVNVTGGSGSYIAGDVSISGGASSGLLPSTGGDVFIDGGYGVIFDGDVLLATGYGKVGIGPIFGSPMIAPSQQLHVYGNTRIDGDLYFGAVQRLISGSDQELRYQSGHDTITQLRMDDKQGTRYGLLYGSGNGANFGLLDGDGQWSYLAVKDNYTAFRINNSEKMKIFSSGAVCIGNTADCDSGWPLFQITGNAPASGGSGASVTMQLENTASDHFASYQLISGNTGYGIASGAIGISAPGRSTNPGDLFVINHTSGGDIGFFTYGNQRRLIITSDGNVGIGDTSPLSLLTVGPGDRFQVNSSGNLIKINNVPYSWPSSQGGADSVLTNNGSGALSWGSGGGGALDARRANGSVVSGMKAGSRYLVSVHGNVRSGSTGYMWQGNTRIENCYYRLVVLDQTNQVWMNWPDGEAPITVDFIITAPSGGCIRAKIDYSPKNGPGGGPSVLPGAQGKVNSITVVELR